MSDTNYVHEFMPNRRGTCKQIIGGRNARHCGLPEAADVHQRFKESVTVIDSWDGLRSELNESLIGQRIVKIERHEFLLQIHLENGSIITASGNTYDGCSLAVEVKT